MGKHILDGDSATRKSAPMARGLLWYFPNALAEVARVSILGNEKHNPGEPLHWAFDKSADHADCVVRHIARAGRLDSDGIRESALAAWRALANLEGELIRDVGVEPGQSVRRDPPAEPEPEAAIGPREPLILSPGAGVALFNSKGEKLADLDRATLWTERNPHGTSWVLERWINGHEVRAFLSSIDGQPLCAALNTNIDADTSLASGERTPNAPILTADDFAAATAAVAELDPAAEIAKRYAETLTFVTGIPHLWGVAVNALGELSGRVWAEPTVTDSSIDPYTAYLLSRAEHEDDDLLIRN